MSQLRVSDMSGRVFKLNVTQFRSPMNASITSVQTRKMLHHFPIRSGQPDINFTVQYASLADKHSFEGFVRKHQQEAGLADKKNPRSVTLWWPERNIENWTGYIISYTVNERRFETAPSATFGVSLIDSMMSERTTIATSPLAVWSIIGIPIPKLKDGRDGILIPPSRIGGQQPINPQDAVGTPTAPPPINSGDAPV